MKSVKKFSLLFVFFLLSTMLSGCSPAEKEFYALQKECAELNAYVDTGEISFSISQLPEDMTEDLSINQRMLLQLLKNLNLTYVQKVDMDRALIATSVYLHLTETSTPQEIVSIICKDKMIYIQVDGMATLLKPFADPGLSPFLDAVNGKKYLSISENEILTLFPAQNNTMQNNSLKYLWDMDKMKQQQQLYQRLVEGLINDVYDQYETGTVEKQGEKFIINLTTQNFIDLVRPFLAYSIDNVDKLENFLISTVENLSDEEIEMLNLDPLDKEIYLQGITEGMNQIKLTAPELLNQWDSSEQMITEEINKVVEDFKLTSTLEKTNANTFDSEVELLLQIKDSTETNDPVEISLKVKDQIKKSNAFNVTAPSEDLISLTDFQAKLPLVMKIQPNYGFYTFNHGLINRFSELDTGIENNRAYVPIRQVTNEFNEKVGWDNTKHQAFVEQDATRIYFTGNIKDDRFFVSVKEFEKIDYKVTWDALTSTVTLTK